MRLICLQMFMMGVTGDLVALSKEVSDPVFMWTTGWGFFFGGFLFTRELGPCLRRTSQGQNVARAQAADRAELSVCGAAGATAADTASACCSGFPSIQSGIQSLQPALPRSGLAAGVHGRDGQLVERRDLHEHARPAQHQLGGG